MKKKKKELEVAVMGWSLHSLGCAELLEVGQCHPEHALELFLTAACS